MALALDAGRRRRSKARYYRFEDTWLEPKPFREDGPRLWFGGRSLHDRCWPDWSRYGHGFNPLGRPSDDDIERLGAAMADAGAASKTSRWSEAPGSVPRRGRRRRLDEALAIDPEQVARGFGTICIKPGQFTDDPAQIPDLCRRIVEDGRQDALLVSFRLVDRSAAFAIRVGDRRKSDRSIAARLSCCSWDRCAATADSSALNFGNSRLDRRPARWA